ncbi:hypothetical protein RFI_19893 [Reticulomyxa filosa]|uniref:Uncharacterized protein n=1 Tax=Reticulomyxa filosa TaxID=46433 RepID=X6MWI5_RETFI|nr:hypothetical protein RFI_19893 [Reticulomyxa filosa]|eukprot:ETO17430.1 hypothetical protein RFI_19893 [Reticulomyxa filosa]
MDSNIVFIPGSDDDNSTNDSLRYYDNLVDTLNRTCASKQKKDPKTAVNGSDLNKDITIPFEDYEARKTYMDNKHNEVLQIFQDLSAVEGVKDHLSSKLTPKLVKSEGDKLSKKMHKAASRGKVCSPNQSSPEVAFLEDEFMTGDEKSEMFDASHFDLQEYIKITKHKLRIVKKKFRSNNMVEALQMTIQVFDFLIF